MISATSKSLSAINGGGNCCRLSFCQRLSQQKNHKTKCFNTNRNPSQLIDKFLAIYLQKDWTATKISSVNGN